MTDALRTQLSERRDQALNDLVSLDEQVVAGEIDSATAERLRKHYEAEAVAALEAIDQLDRPAAPAPAGRSRTRVIAGIALFVAASGAATVALVNAVQPRPEGGFVTGGIASDVVAEGGVDLATVTTDEMEAVVAANPDIVPMRLALARRYVEAGDFSTALPHYLYVLEREQNAEALMYVGWMTYVSGEADTGIALIQRSLQISPDDPLAEWFLANALLYGTNDPGAAIPVLEALIASDSAPADIIAEAHQMLEEARS